MEAENSLVGTWKLVSWEAQTAEGNTVHPFGENAAGWIMYDGEGNVSVHLMRRDRTQLSTDDPFGGTAELTEIAKTKSVSALPEKYNEIDDDFMKYALQSVVDGIDPDTLKAILNEKKERMMTNISSNLDLFINSVLAIQLGKEQDVKRLCDE